MIFIDLADEPIEHRVYLLHQFYDEIYRDAFPHPDQAESPDVWLPLMDGMPGTPQVHVILACQADCILGGLIFERYSSCWLATYVAVHPLHRRKGVAAGLFAKMKMITGTGIIFAEAENPSRVTEPFAQVRLGILSKLGLQRLPFAYVQPALDATKQVLDDLILLSDTCVTTTQVIDFLTEFYVVNDQADSSYLARMCEMLRQHPLTTKICVRCQLDLPDTQYRLQASGNQRSECRKCESKGRMARPRGEPSEETKRRAKEANIQYNRKLRRDPRYRARTIWTDSKHFDKSRGLEHALSVQDIQELLDTGCCSYCGETAIKLTLDRIDNSIGHVMSNVVVACYRCNVLRGNMPYTAWINFIPVVRDTREKGLFDGWTGGVQKVIHMNGQ